MRVLRRCAGMARRVARVSAPKRRKRPEASTRVLKGDGPPLTSTGDAWWIDDDLGNVFSSRSAVGTLIGLLFNIR